MSRTALCLIVLSASCSVQLPAQQLFERTYGSSGPDVGEAVAITPDGLVVVGSTFGLGGPDQDALVLSLDADGLADWSIRTGGPGADVAFDVLGMANNELLVAVKHADGQGGFANGFLVLDGTGTIMDQRSMGQQGSQVRCRLAALTDSTFLLVGSHETAPPDLLLSSMAGIYRTDGTAIGIGTWSDTFAQEAYGATATADGGALVVGYSRGYHNLGTSDMLAIRLNGAGDTLWTRAYGGGFLGSLAFDAEQTADGGFILCGERDGNGTLVRLDTNGDLLWARSYGTAFNGDGLIAVVALSDGFAACGRIQGQGADNQNALLIRTDLNGDTLFTRTYGDVIEDEARDVKLLADGGFVLTGSRSDAATGTDVWVARTDASGLTGCDRGSAQGLVVNTLNLATQGAPMTAGSLGDAPLSWSGIPVVPDPAIQCQTQGITEDPIRSLLAHPNPATGRIALQGTFLQVRAFDALGRAVDLPVLRTQADVTVVDLSFLSGGMYPIQALDREGNRYAGRVVVLP
ncbi:MAG: hypothetical protein KDC02_05705 [Flavobacteriales bacterium]|nr:hypothetical protein [Flavobacteriales bacterium]